MTVADLYQSSDAIRSLIDFWTSERRCPMGLVDELLWHNLPNAADCAMWAATYEERPMIYSRDQCAPYPNRAGYQTVGWYWNGWKESMELHAHIVPMDIPTEPDTRHFQRYPTPTEAIIWLLDHWKAEVPVGAN